jgi:hypothetical protein
MKLSLSLAVLLAGSILLAGGGEAFSTPPLARPSRSVHTLSFAPPPTVNNEGSSSMIINTKLYAATVVDVSTASLMLNGGNDKPPGWHRRVIGRVFGRSNDGRRPQSSSQPIRAVAIAHQQYGYDDLAVAQHQERRRRFLSLFRGRNRPLELALPPTTTATKTTAITKETAARANTTSSSFYARWLERTVENNLAGRFDRWTDGIHTNMCITSELKRPALHVLSGTLSLCNVRLSADRLVFGAFRCSGGILTATQLSLNLFSLSNTSIGKHRCRQPRYPNAFDFHVEKLILTQRDLLESSCIRNGLRHLLTWILDRSISRAFLAKNNKNGRSRNGGTGSVSGVSLEIKSIEILSATGEIVVRGVVNTFIAFAVKTGLGTSGRGHILTFPGLELYFLDNDMMRLPIPNITVDLGHNAELLHIDTTTTPALTAAAAAALSSPPQQQQGGCLTISAKVRITPDHTRIDALTKYQQSSASFGSVCSVDVGAWLTRLGRFSE